MPAIEVNPTFQQVINFVNLTNKNIFLTGKAGTGKTTLLKYLRNNSFKQMAIVAPTGVAAINAGGSTIHSFFQFPFSPFLPSLKDNGEVDYTKNALPALKYNSQRLAIFRNLELLIIDEVSMVRADLLDQIDAALRYTRRRSHVPFGGVQVLLIGDMYQLPPVVQAGEWELLGAAYQGPFFFDSHVIKNNPPVYIELEKIYRQSDQDFIDLLNKVRNNILDGNDLDKLNQKYKPGLSQKDYQENITLTTHNKKADEINWRNLEALAGKSQEYVCETDGHFSEKNYPADEKLILKKGARVMFLKNNTEKNYYNGKIGEVTVLDKKTVKVKCRGDAHEIEVGPEIWRNVSYAVNKSNKHVEEEVLGTFSQLPLRHAWAITIHKSQGLTFDKLIVDAAESFSAGQVYVALSRCRSLQGLTLSTPLSPKALMSDKAVINFADTRPEPGQVETIFNNSSKEYFRQVLYGLFDFSEILELRKEAGGVIQQHRSRFTNDGLLWINEWFTRLETQAAVALKFRGQLNTLYESGTPELLNERLGKASVYFVNELNQMIVQLKTNSLVSDSKMAAEGLGLVMQELFELLYAKKEMIDGCANGFDLPKYAAKKLNLQYPAFRINFYASAGNMRTPANVKHPVLYRSLLLLRDDLCNHGEIPVYLVAPNKTLAEMAEYLPETEEQLLLISGMGKARVSEFGARFLEVIKEYMQANELVSLMHTRAPSKSKKKKAAAEKKDTAEKPDTAQKPSSREQSFLLYKQGTPLKEIARQRGYSLTTIEGHLAPYVAEGKLHIDELVPADKQALIHSALETFDKAGGLNPVKSKLPADISFSEIRFVLASREWELKKQNSQPAE